MFIQLPPESVPNKYVEFLLQSVQDEGRKWYKKYWGGGGGSRRPGEQFNHGVTSRWGI